MNACDTCEHSKRSEVDGDLLREEPLAVLARRYGLRRDSLRTHKAKHISLTPAEREAALADSAIRAWARAQAEIPILAAKEAERLERERVAAEDRRGLQLAQERFKALKLGAERREQRMAEQDERMAKWGDLLDRLAEEVEKLANAKTGAGLLGVLDQLMALIDRGVKVSNEVRGLMMDAARHGGELRPDALTVEVMLARPEVTAVFDRLNVWALTLPDDLHAGYQAALSGEAVPRLGGGR